MNIASSTSASRRSTCLAADVRGTKLESLRPALNTPEDPWRERCARRRVSVRRTVRSTVETQHMRQGGLHGGVTVELGFKDAWELMIPRERKLQNTIPPLNFSMTARQGSWRVRSLTC